MRELVPPPWRHRILGRWRVGSLALRPSVVAIERVIGIEFLRLVVVGEEQDRN